MPVFGSTNFAWFQPDESKLNETWGGENNSATAVVKIKGNAVTRRQAVDDFLEYPILTTTNGISYIQRHLPLAYGVPFNPTSENIDEGFWASKILSGEGKGPIGQAAVGIGDDQAVAIPLYQYYLYTLLFEDRTYDVLPDADVLAPGPLITPVQNNLVLSAVPGLLPAATYAVEITATTGDGETGASNEKTIVVAANFSAIVASWGAVAGAVGYKVYIGNAGAGSESHLSLDLPATITSVTIWFFGGQAATPPLVNTTAGPLWDAGLNVGRPDEGYWLAQGNGQVGGRYVTREDEPGGYPQTIPRGFLHYQDTDVVIPEGIMKVVPTIQRSLTWHMIPRSAVPVGAIISQQGTVNNAAFDGYPAGTLLFDGVKPRRYRDPRLNRVIDLQYRFSCKPNVNRFGGLLGWNSALEFIPQNGANPAFVDYVNLWSDTGGRGSPPYRSSNFATLFRPPQ